MSVIPQKIILTGGAGFIGSTMVAQLVESGHEVIVLDSLTYAGHEENLNWIANDGKGTWRLAQGDITDGSFVNALIQEVQPDAMMNFAAESHVDNSILSPSDFINTNIIGTYTLLEATRTYWNGLSDDAKQAFRFLQVSTDEVYGSLELGSPEKFSEATQVKPSSPYSASKAAGDHLANAWYHTYGLPTIVTNCTNNYGPRQFPEKLIPHMLTQALSGEPLPVYGDGLNVRDWIHVEDHCRGVYLALTKGRVGEGYCFGGNAERQNIDVVKILCQTLDEIKPRDDGKSYAEQITFVKDRPGHDRRYAMDDSKARSELGFTSQYTFETGLKQTLDWYLNNQNWCQSVTQKAA